MMTASRRKALLLAGAAFVFLGGAAASAQEATEETTGTVAEETAADQARPTEAVQSEHAARRTWYLGGKPTATNAGRMSSAPALGAPRTISPAPYVPVGSVTAAAPMAGEAQVVTPPVAEGTGLQAPAETVVPMDGVPIEEGALNDLDPSTVAATSEGLPSGFFTGLSRAAYVSILDSLPSPSGSRLLGSIASRLALSGPVLPAPENDQSMQAVVKSRLDLLARAGDGEGFARLFENLPKGQAWPMLAHEAADAHLLAGRVAEACNVADTQRANTGDPYWIRLLAFCSAVDGNRDAVRFQMGILEELTDVGAEVHQMIERILVASEQARAAGGASAPVPPAPVALEGKLKVDVLDVTMAGLAAVDIGELTTEEIDPLAVGPALAIQTLSRDAKFDLVSLAVTQGWVNDRTLAAFLGGQAFTEAELAAAMDDGTEENDSFVIDAALAHIAVTNGDAGARQAALAKLWARAVRLGHVAVMGGALAHMGLDVDPANANSAVAGPVIRSLLLAGQTETVAAYFRTLRDNMTGPTDEALLTEVWPLMLVAGMPDVPGPEAGPLPSWWSTQGTDDRRYARAGLLFSLLEALGESVPDAAWSSLEEGPVALEQSATAPAVWRRLLLASSAGDRPLVLSNGYRIVAESGLADVSPAPSGSVVQTLRRAGFEGEARQLALEILIAQGL
ncbi:hypothetical protein [Gimibacter soli]|uniref:Antifreeze glycopeptide polyprotein n=1 Tax=Gimibacter soli TaxID=3024400 RepID=A0AAE9XW12_9PROT|nr:hypothetical protein [Gimibacter soli]WCL54174.1 hypothetical protein PH603_00185 [Gimibacter soli]